MNYYVIMMAFLLCMCAIATFTALFLAWVSLKNTADLEARVHKLDTCQTKNDIVFYELQKAIDKLANCLMEDK